jgi:hypothetical protein
MCLIVGGPLEVSLMKKYPTCKARRVEDPDAETRPKLSTYETINGKKVWHNEKHNIVDRLRSSVVCRRMTEVDVLNVILTNEVNLDAGVAWGQLVAMGQQHDMGSGGGKMLTQLLLKNTRRWTHLKKLPAAQSSVAFERAMMGEWSGPTNFDWSKLSLQDFCREDMCDDVGDKATQRVLIGDAMLNWEHFLVFCHGSTFDGITTDVRASVSVGPLSDDSWDAGYIRFLIEGCLFEVFKILRQVSVSDYLKAFPTVDISTPMGVRALIMQSFKDIVPTVVQGNKWAAVTWVSVVNGPQPLAVWTIGITSRGVVVGFKGPGATRGLKAASKTAGATGRPTAGPTTVSGLPAAKAAGAVIPTPAVAALPRVASVAAPVARPSARSLCRSEFCHQIGMKNLRGQQFAACKRGTSCQWDHVDVSAMTKPQKVALATAHKAVFGPLFDTVIKSC